MSSPARLAIETPESVRFRYELADVGARALALTIDTLVQYVVLGLGFVALTYAVRDVLDIGPAVWIVGVFAIHWFYFVFFELAWSGQTPGKRLVGIRVVRAGGYPVTFLAVLTRNLLRVIDWLPMAYGVGLVSAFCEPERRRLGDLVARTLVVRERSAPVAWVRKPFVAKPASDAWGDALVGLTLDEAARELILDYLARRGDLFAGARARVRAEILETVLDRVPTPEQRKALLGQLTLDRQDAFLERVATS